jgi:antitoxin FitA
MSVMIQIRNVPDALHRRLKARAALAGVSLSDYLLSEIRDVAALPTREELVERLRNLPPLDVRETAAEAIQAGRGERERRLTVPSRRTRAGRARR